MQEESLEMDGPYRATKLWNEMLHTFKHGMPLKRHRRHMRIYDCCFTGAEAVNWLQIALKENPNIKPGISKSQIRQLLNKFLKAGVFCSVCGSSENQEFKESEVYRFSPYSSLLQTTAEVSRPAYERVIEDPQNLVEVPHKGNRHPMYNIANCNENSKNGSDLLSTKKCSSEMTCASRPTYAMKESYSCSTRGSANPNSYEYANVNKNKVSSSKISNVNFPVLQAQNPSSCSLTYRPFESDFGVSFPGALTNRYDSSQNIKSQQKYQQHEAPAFLRNPATSAHIEKLMHFNAHKPQRSPSYEFACHNVKNVKVVPSQYCHENVENARVPSQYVNYGMPHRRNTNYGNSENCSLAAPVKPPRAHNMLSKENKQNLPLKSCQPQHNVISMHDSRRVNNCNTYRRKPAAKIISDIPSQFPSSEESYSKYYIEDKYVTDESKHPNNSRAEQCTPNPELDVYDALNMAFVLRLETVLAGMEEIAALLPTSLRIDWFIRNVLEHTNVFRRAGSVDSGLDERLEDVINNFQEEFTGGREPLINIELYSIITESFSYIEHINAASKQFICKTRDTIPTTKSIENLVLGMASPCISNNKSHCINDKQRMAPAFYCYETAFASDTPVTRIVPQCSVETVQLTRRGISKSFRCSRERTSTSDGRVNEAGIMKRNASLSHMPPVSDPTKVVWRSKSSQDVKDFCDDYVNVPGMNYPVSYPQEKPHSHRQRSWRLSKKRAEAKEKNSGLQHCRNKSGGYVNPALSQSWEDLSQSLCSQEFDYTAALESLQNIMKTNIPVEDKRNDNVDMNGDVSSESSSYHTAASTPDRQKYTNASLTKEQELRNWKQPAMGLGISVYQLLMLLLPPSNRSSLKRLLRCLHNLPTAINQTETLQIIQSMTPKMLACEDVSDRSLSFRVVKFFVTFYKEIMEVPPEMYAEVVKYIPLTSQSQKMTFCEQVTSKQFAEQGLSSSQKALSELLDQIVNDARMPDKEKKRKLKMFKERYPDIYRQHFPHFEEERVTSDKARGILQLPSFGKRKNIRI